MRARRSAHRSFSANSVGRARRPCDPHVDSKIAQGALLVAVVDVTVARAVQGIQPVPDEPVTVDTTSQVYPGRADAVAGVARGDVAQLMVGGALGNEVEHSRRVGRPVERGREAVDDFDLLKLFHRVCDGDVHRHPVQLAVLEVAALHAARLRAQDVRSLLLLIRHQRQVLRYVPEVDRLRVLDHVAGQNADGVRRIQHRRCSERPERIHGRRAVVLRLLPGSRDQHTGQPALPRLLRRRRGIAGMRDRGEHQGQQRRQHVQGGSVRHAPES